MYRTIVKVDGMSCGMCEAHVNDAVRNNFSVKKVTSSRKKGETEILSEEAPDAEKLKSVIASSGYTAGEVTTEVYVKKSLFSFGRK